jgi:hypothetical protein
MKEVIVYSYFGRVLKIFSIPKDRTHHEALESARAYLVQTEKSGINCWIKII